MDKAVLGKLFCTLDKATLVRYGLRFGIAQRKVSDVEITCNLFFSGLNYISIPYNRDRGEENEEMSILLIC